MARHEENAGADLIVGIEKVMSEFRASLATTKVAVAIVGAEVRPLRSGLAGKNLSASNGRLMGYTLRETTGAATATMYLRDGTDNTGDMLAAIQLAAGESRTDWFGPGGVNFGLGLFWDLVAGSVEGSVFINGTSS